jgi:hypothetical protein
MPTVPIAKPDRPAQLDQLDQLGLPPLIPDGQRRVEVADEGDAAWCYAGSLVIAEAVSHESVGWRPVTAPGPASPSPS